ncbi:MAG: hypothetical protein IJ443_05005 [Firmicutes bacterium]|nr:hypothetical protein [Bacillota bacterium]
MFDPFMNGSMPVGFGFGCPEGLGGPGYMEDDGLNPYGEELDEHQEQLMRLAACMPMYKCGTFEDTLENVCYICNVDVESLSERDVEWLRENVEE